MEQEDQRKTSEQVQRGHAEGWSDRGVWRPLKPSAGTSERSLIQQRYDFYGSIHVITQANKSDEV